MNDKKAFVLIEIIISVIILSISCIGLLKVDSNQKKLYAITQKKLSFTEYSSIVANRSSIKLHQKNLNLYELLKNEYRLKNSDLINTLKKIDMHYTQKYKDVINIKFDEESKPINILIDKIKVSNKKGTSIYFTVKL